MKIVSTTQRLTDLDADAIVVGIPSDQTLVGAAQSLNRATNGQISTLIEMKEFYPDPCQILALYLPEAITSPVVVLIGLGPSNQFNCRHAFQCFGTAARFLSQKKRSHIGIYLDEGLAPDVIESIVAGVIVGCHGQDLYRHEKKQYSFEKVSFGFKHTDALRTGQVLGESVNLARELVNQPADTIYPFSFASRARAVASEVGMEFELWDQGRMQSEQCNALLAVARGAYHLPCMTIMRHQGASSPDDVWLALVGKGVTFDSGGLSLKPTEGMKTMKSDMAGGATVLAVMQAIAALNLPINVMGLVGLVENMPSDRSFKLGDVIRSKNGKTIEILNTDAEGRVVLADVLAVAIEQGADRIIDIATLTGACVVALGNDVTGTMTNDQRLCDQVLAAAEACGERTWQLPMFSEFDRQIKSEIADIKNTGEGRWGGAITAAKFLEAFVNDVPWVHLDIAGPAFAQKSKPWLDGGGTGVMVRTLVELARNWHP